MKYCIETSGLTHRYRGDEKVIEGVDLKVPEGSIYGFLGPNGAGKTTTLRLLLGLIRKQEGSISIFGRSFSSGRIEILRSIGSLIESPSLYGHLSAKENLRIWQKIYQCDPSRMDEVLRLVGLADTGKKKAGQFSLGMKQRLSIAVALLNDPSLLILDEPTNGLDPQGILEMRALLKELNESKGVTILVSSHLLAEIERLVTHVGIIDHGQLKFQGTLAELSGRQSSQIIIGTGDPSRAMNVISAFVAGAKLKEEKIILPSLPKEKMAMLNRELVSQNMEVFEISYLSNDLETIFMNLVNPEA